MRIILGIGVFLPAKGIEVFRWLTGVHNGE